MCSRGKGYIVVGPRGAVELGRYSGLPKGGLLLSGKTATVFGSHTTATRAIQRTVAYAERHGLSAWTKRDQFRIYRLTDNPNAAPLEVAL